MSKYIEPEPPQTVVSMVAATPKPRVVKLLISSSGKHSFSTGGSPPTAVGFVIKVGNWRCPGVRNHQTRTPGSMRRGANFS